VSGPRTSTVSVIVPSHNHAAFLDAALESVHAQTWRPLDVIVVDDGSTDGTSEVLTPWQARGVRAVRQNRAGASAARNRGIAMAEGEFIAFLDADDLWPRADMLDAAMAQFAADPALGWTFGDARPFSGDGDARRFLDVPYLLAGGYYRPGTGPDDAEAAQARTVTPGDLCNNDRFFIPTGTLLIRKRCFDEVGGFDERLKMFEDTDMWLRLLRYPLVFFPSVLLWRRVHGANVSHRRWAHLDDLRTLFERHDLASHGVSFHLHAARSHYHAGRDAWRRREFALAAREFGDSLRHRPAWKPSVLYAAASLAARLRPPADAALHAGGRDEA
jgi:glycosyltransferase involved in cell wall biosynthesis